MRKIFLLTFLVSLTELLSTAAAMEGDIQWVESRMRPNDFDQWSLWGNKVYLRTEGSCVAWYSSRCLECQGADAYLGFYNTSGELTLDVAAGRALSTVCFLPDGSAIVLSDNVFWPRVTRYGPDGNLVWRTGTVGDDWGRVFAAVAAFTDESCVVVGGIQVDTTFGQGDPNETTLVVEDGPLLVQARYNPDGTLAWARSIGPYYCEHISEIGESGLFQLASLPDSSWLFAGTADGPMVFGAGEAKEQTLDLESEQAYVFLAKYNPDGSLAWAKKVAEGYLPGSSGTDVIGMGLTGFRAAADGSIVVAGRFCGRAVLGPSDVTRETLDSAESESESTDSRKANPPADAFLAKFNSRGQLQWVVRAGGDGEDTGAGAVILSDGSVLATGNYTVPATFGEADPNETQLNTTSGVYLARYDTCGQLLYAKPAAYAAQVSGIDGAIGNRYVITGWFSGTATFGPASPNEEAITASGNRAMFVATYQSGDPAPPCGLCCFAKNPQTSDVSAFAPIILAAVCLWRPGRAHQRPRDR